MKTNREIAETVAAEYKISGLRVYEEMDNALRQIRYQLSYQEKIEIAHSIASNLSGQPMKNERENSRITKLRNDMKRIEMMRDSYWRDR